VVVGVHVDAVKRVLTRCRSWQFPYATQLAVKPRFQLVDGELELVPLPFANTRQFLECALAGELEQRLAEHDRFQGSPPLILSFSLARLHAAHSAEMRREYEGLWEGSTGEAFQLVVAILEEFRRAALEGGAEEFLVLIFPNRKDYLLGDVERGVPFFAPSREHLEQGRFQVIDFDRRLVAAAVCDWITDCAVLEARRERAGRSSR
jgi:hypothetical protein